MRGWNSSLRAMFLTSSPLHAFVYCDCGLVGDGPSQTKNPPPDCSGGGLRKLLIESGTLAQQHPRARTGKCATTTRAACSGILVAEHPVIEDSECRSPRQPHVAVR